MKKIFFTFLITILYFTSYGQETPPPPPEKLTFESATYFHNVSANEVPRFVELYKKFTDMSLIGKKRTITGEYLFRHWYGSGHTFVAYQQYETMDDYHKDSDIINTNIRKQIEATENKKEKEMLAKEWGELRAFWDGHTDEIRGAYEKTAMLTIENVNFDTPFVMSVGRYNSSGSWSKLGNAFFDWSIKPGVTKGTSIAGGVTYHYMGSGHEVEVWQCFNSLVDFAKAVSTPSKEDEKRLTFNGPLQSKPDETIDEARKTFWSLVEGSHEDQIYLHIGNVNLNKGIFDLAGEDR